MQCGCWLITSWILHRVVRHRVRGSICMGPPNWCKMPLTSSHKCVLDFCITMTREPCGCLLDVWVFDFGSVPIESDPWRVTSGLCGGRGGGEWGGRWQHGSSSTGGSAAVPPAPPGAVPHSAGGVPGRLPPARRGKHCRGSQGEQEDLCRWRQWQRWPGAARHPSLSPFAPAITYQCRAGKLPRHACPWAQYL